MRDGWRKLSSSVDSAPCLTGLLQVKEMRFVCDVMLGKLARYLRVFGIDAVYAKTAAEFERYVDAGEGQTFYLLTRRSRVKYGDRTLFVRSDRPREQLREIWHIVSPLVDPDTVMARCIECNVPLVHVSREDIEQYVPEFVFHRYKNFKKCPACGRVYWEGSHACRMSRFIKEVAVGEGSERVEN